MLSVLSNRAFSKLFLAQCVALLGTGLLTVALALLAYDLAGKDAGIVLGTALAIKMTVYVIVAPVAGALVANLPRRTVLVSLDLVRAAIAVMLPFVTEIWEIYVLIFFLQSASAAFTPTFQAIIPDILPDEEDYTKALSLSRLAQDMESLLSPLFAGVLLGFITFNLLFVGTSVGFVLSAALVIITTLPMVGAPTAHSFRERLTRGIRIYAATPRLRGLMSINLAVAAAGAIVIVNTVVIVQGMLGLGERDTAMALASFGGGSMLVALILPRILGRVPDRAVMLTGAVLLAAGAFATGTIEGFETLAVLWFILGSGFALALTPSGRLLKRSVQAEDRPSVFAAQFALSHACWLLTYPLAGWLGANFGLLEMSLVLGSLASVGIISALMVWPRHDPEIVEHKHPDLPDDHPHLQSGAHGESAHAHEFFIDDLHVRWPSDR